MIQLILSVAGLTLVGLASPGPNFVLITGRALSSGRRSACASAIGVSAGSLTHAVFGIAGFGALLRSSGSLFVAAKLIGAGYLIWIGSKSLRSAMRSSRRHSAYPGSPTTPQAVSSRRSLIDGYLTQMSNPKSTLFFLAIFTTVVPADIGIVQGVVVVATISVLALGAYSLIAVVFSRDLFRRRYQSIGHHLDAVFGVLMIGLGIRVALGER